MSESNMSKAMAFNALNEPMDVMPPMEPATAWPFGAPTVAGQRTVKVELVWPAERGAKIDCRANTKTVWAGQGDVQDFPADLWHLLAPHPDVWRLVDPGDEVAAKRAAVAQIESPEQRVARINLAMQRDQAAQLERDERLRLETEAAKLRGAETNTDVVVVQDPPDPLSAEEAANRTAAYKLVTQDPEALDLALIARDQATRAAASVAAPGLNTPRASPVVFDAAQLAEMSDADVHAEGLKRGFVLHPRLNPVNLRAKFLELQG